MIRYGSNRALLSVVLGKAISSLILHALVVSGSEGPRLSEFVRDYSTEKRFCFSVGCCGAFMKPRPDLEIDSLVVPIASFDAFVCRIVRHQSTKPVFN